MRLLDGDLGSSGTETLVPRSWDLLFRAALCGRKAPAVVDGTAGYGFRRAHVRVMCGFTDLLLLPITPVTEGDSGTRSGESAFEDGDRC